MQTEGSDNMSELFLKDLKDATYRIFFLFAILEQFFDPSSGF